MYLCAVCRSFDGGNGFDWLSSGAGNDTFATGWGEDTIADFTVHAGTANRDLIQSLDGGGEVALNGVLKSALTASDFWFV